MMIYSDNMIAWQNSSNVSRNTNDTRSRGRSRHLTLSARLRHLIYPGFFLTGGLPAAIIEDRGVITLQDQSPLTVLLPPQRLIPDEGFQGGYMTTV